MSRIDSEKLVGLLSEAAEEHGENTEGWEMAFGDLQQMLSLAFRRMSQAQLRKVVSDISEEIEAPEYRKVRAYLAERTE